MGTQSGGRFLSFPKMNGSTLDQNISGKAGFLKFELTRYSRSPVLVCIASLSKASSQAFILQPKVQRFPLKSFLISLFSGFCFCFLAYSSSRASHHLRFYLFVSL